MAASAEKAETKPEKAETKPKQYLIMTDIARLWCIGVWNIFATITVIFIMVIMNTSDCDR